MKQFRMVALMGLTLLMGVIMTACVGGNDETDNKTTQNVIALYDNGQLVQYGGGILVPTNPSALPAKTGMYTFTIEYTPNTWSDNKLSVTIVSDVIDLTNQHVKKGEGSGNINLYDVQYSSEMVPSMFNQDYILVPCIFWMENVSASNYSSEEAKHTFSLLYPDDLTSDDGVLNLTLIDEVSDPELERTKSSYLYQAFNLKDVIASFKAANGGYISGIRLWGNTNRITYDPMDDRTHKNYVDVELTK